MQPNSQPANLTLCGTAASQPMSTINSVQMGFLDKLFGQKKPSSTDEHGVIIHFQYGKEDLDPLHHLERQLEDILTDKTVGDYDGHEIATDYSDGFLYLYGDNAEQLFKKIRETLESTDFMMGARVKLRFGPPQDGVKEIELIIGER